MELSTALKISGIAFLALMIEMSLAFFMYSNFAFSLSETGGYITRQAYSSGPLALMTKIFYGIFGITIAIGIGAPLVSLVSRLFRRGSKG